MPDVQNDRLTPDLAARLTAFARACKGAARAVSLYPPEHPAIGDALGRLGAAASGATEAGPLSLLVIPNNLLVGGKATPRPDAAVAELAAILHAHMVGELTIQPGVNAAAWRALLALLGTDPDDLRSRGGIARALTTAGGIGIEIAELDYSGLIKEGEAEASWQSIIATCLQKDALELDERTLRLLAEIAADPARLAEFFERTEAQGGKHSVRDRTEAILRALRAIAGYYGREAPGRLDEIFDNMASALAHLSPEFVLDVVAIGGEPDAESGSLVHEITSRVRDHSIAQFVARSVASENGCTARLADAFRALAPEQGRQGTVVALAREELARTPMGDEPGFDRLWSVVEEILLSYSDRRWVSDSYNQELSAARARAGDPDLVAADPPDRVVGWLTTVSDSSLRALDLLLLSDLLLVLPDAARRQELVDLVVSQVDELVVLGDFDSARHLVDALAAVATNPGLADARAQVTRGLAHLVSGQFMWQVAVHLNAVRDDEFEQVKLLCAGVGPTLVPKLAEVLSTETRPRARQRLTDLLIAFGKHGRDSVAQLRSSPSASVRRTAVQLLRSFGGPDALTDLETLAGDAEGAVRRDAARALVAMGFGESFEVVERIVRNGRHPGRAAVVEEIGATRDPNTTPLLCHLVRRLEWRGSLRETYLQAVERLGVIGGPDAVVALSEALRSGGWWAPIRTREVRREAAAALAQIRLPAAQDALRDAAEHGSFGVRSIARRYAGGQR